MAEYKTEYTKKQGVKARITGIISLLLNVIPLVIFTIIGFVQGEPHQKLTLGFTIVAALALTVLMVMAKFNLKRTTFWLVVMGIFICMENLESVFITMGVCNVIDEVIVSPLHKKFKEEYKTNKHIDKREYKLAQAESK